MACAVSLKRGDLIMKSQPFAYALNNDHRGRVCDFCFRQNDKLKKCTRCLFSYYCNTECQKSAWEDHKHECSNLKRIYPAQPEKYVRLIARVIYKLKRKPDEYETFANITRRFRDLISHSEEIKNDPSRTSHRVNTIRMITEFLPPNDCPSSDELLEIYGKIMVNSFGITDQILTLGAGLYLGASIFDHSCEPNAAGIYEGPNLLISAMEDIEKPDLSNVFVSYIDVWAASTEERRRGLKKNYYFDCNCTKCLDEEKDLITKSILCPNPNCTTPTVIKEDIFKCLKCGEVKYEKNKLCQVQELTEKCKKTLDEIDKLRMFNKQNEISERAELCIDEMKSKLHFLNVNYARILERAFEANVALSKWESACKLTEQLILAWRFYYGNFDPSVGAKLFNAGYAWFNTFNFVQAEKTLRLALEVISVTHPKDHWVTRTCQSKLSACQMRLSENPK